MSLPPVPLAAAFAEEWEKSIRRAMRREHIAEDDVREELRMKGKLEDPKKVKAARLERSGEVSVLKREEPPRIVEVRVENGVQTVRIEIGSAG